MTIWGKYKDKPIEKIDSCKKKDAEYMINEYKLAFGRDWIIWAGKKSDYKPFDLVLTLY